MAAIIDGSTYKGYFKIVSDDGAPLVYYAFPKNGGVALKGIDADTFELVSATGAYTSVAISLSIGNGVEDENGNAFASVGEVLQYLSDNR